MTFSDSRVVELVEKNFVPVWESVAPVSVAVFDLGGGRTVQGTMSGEIALYFCRPDGKVFDILPALHSPHVTYWAIREALDFYERTGASDEALRAYHAEKLAALVASGKGADPNEVLRSKRKVKAKLQAAPDGGTKALTAMAGLKTTMRRGDYTSEPGSAGYNVAEPMTVVEPGGLGLFKRQVHEALATAPPRTPQEWKEHVFVKILDEELRGGNFRYDVDALVPIAISEE